MGGRWTRKERPAAPVPKPSSSPEHHLGVDGAYDPEELACGDGQGVDGREHRWLRPRRGDGDGRPRAAWYLDRRVSRSIALEAQLDGGGGRWLEMHPDEPQELDVQLVGTRLSR